MKKKSSDIMETRKSFAINCAKAWSIQLYSNFCFDTNQWHLRQYTKDIRNGIIKEFGIDSKESIASGILQGGSETTVYVLGVYLACTHVKKTKHLYYVGLFGNVLSFILTLLLLLFIL